MHQLPLNYYYYYFIGSEPCLLDRPSRSQTRLKGHKHKTLSHTAAGLTPGSPQGSR